MDNKITLLSDLFSKYQIYSNAKYVPNSPIGVFNNVYTENYYSKDIKLFLSKHDYIQNKRGADLPWWGENYFSDNNCLKTMIVAQDSKSKDAGSVVFFANLYNVINVNNDLDYKAYNSKINGNFNFKYNNWRRAYQQLLNWKIDLNNCYITDANKVYKENSWDKFDRLLSAKLLEEEISICKPNVVILLGREAVEIINKTNLINRKIIFSEQVEKGEIIENNGIKFIVSPFITGLCHTAKNYYKRLEIASDALKSYI